MPDLYGPIQHLAIAQTLWLILAPPVLAALFCAWRALARRRGPGARPLTLRSRRAIAAVSLAATATSFAAGVYHSVVLSQRPDDARFLLQHLWRMIRVGQLDASFDLAFDPLSATLVLVVTGIGLPIFVFAAGYMKDDPSFARFFAWLNGFLALMLLLVLADNFVLLLFGWEGVGLCSWGLIGFWWQDGSKPRAGAKAFVVNRVGDAAFLVGVALLYWGLGGSWVLADYVPDLKARFSSIAVGSAGIAPVHAAEPAPRGTTGMPGVHDEDEEAGREHAHPSGEGFLTMASYSGATIFMDDARAPLHAGGELLRAPFARFPIKAGVHSFRIHPGEGVDDLLVTHLAFGDGGEIALAPLGPSLTFRNLRDQLSARDLRGDLSARDALLAKPGAGGATMVTLACLLLFAGAVGKSAQFPLFIWLPEAMAAPSPVSALLHAATMVTAGVYMIARLSFLFALSPAASAVVAVVGAGTALLAAVAGMYQYDLKRILAYSTVSQLGLMVMAMGVGAYQAGIFHLVTHACFKACLFLAAGAVLHALHPIETVERHRHDVRRMGGLEAALPRTARAYFVGCLAITAAPIPGLAGFWSKDEILARTLAAGGPLGAPLTATAALAGALTSFYMWRSFYLVFRGQARTPLTRLHEGGRAMAAALVALATLSATAGVLGIGPRLLGRAGESLLGAWLAPVFRGTASLADGSRGGPALEWGIVAASWALALCGWAVARARYAAPAVDWEARERRSLLFAPSSHAWWLDALLRRAAAPLVVWASAFVAEFDRRVVDGLANAVGAMSRALAWVVGRADDAVVDGAVRAFSEGTLHLGERVRAAQTGRIQTYVYVLSLGVLAVAFLQYWLR